MYSYEDRIRVVDLYIKPGKRKAVPTIAGQIGSRASLMRRSLLRCRARGTRLIARHARASSVA